MVSKTYQVPKKDHPWRQYADRVRDIEGVDITVELELVTVREYLTTLVENWDTMTVTFQSPFEGNTRHKLKTLPQYKIAAWLAGTLKKHYVQNKYD